MATTENRQKRTWQVSTQMVHTCVSLSCSGEESHPPHWLARFCKGCLIFPLGEMREVDCSSRADWPSKSPILTNRREERWLSQQSVSQPDTEAWVPNPCGVITCARNSNTEEWGQAGPWGLLVSKHSLINMFLASERACLRKLLRLISAITHTRALTRRHQHSHRHACRPAYTRKEKEEEGWKKGRRKRLNLDWSCL